MNPKEKLRDALAGEMDVALDSGVLTVIIDQIEYEISLQEIIKD